MTRDPPRATFVLSPADCRGHRAGLLVRPGATFPLAVALQRGEARLGDVFAFVSGIYFQGKLAYAQRFGSVVRVIVPGRGLCDPMLRICVEHVEAFAQVDADADTAAFVVPLVRDAKTLPADGPVVLLGSVATRKYVDPLFSVVGERLAVPAALIGVGDKRRGKLLLERAASGEPFPLGPVPPPKPRRPRSAAPG